MFPKPPFSVSQLNAALLQLGFPKESVVDGMKRVQLSLASLPASYHRENHIMLITSSASSVEI